MNIDIIILILALVGLGETLYLNYERVNNKRPPVCIIGSDCKEVWASKYSKTFGVSNEILGIVFYSTISVIETAILAGVGSKELYLGQIILILSGTIMSIYFIFLQWKIIKKWCFWCTISAFIVWGMFVALFIF
jgi:uncharacterized membrane protein